MLPAFQEPASKSTLRLAAVGDGGCQETAEAGVLDPQWTCVTWVVS